MRNLVVGMLVVGAVWLSVASVRAQGGPAPILVVLNSSAPNPFGAYLPEILRTEGISSYSTIDLGTLDAGDLVGVSLVVLAETPLSDAQAALLTGFVGGGGRLIAMRPDTRLDAVLGITDAGATTANGYTLIAQAGVGVGLPSATLPFRGTARHVALAGATQVAALYSSSTTATGWPAVVRHGRTAAWTFDLARSTAFTRQGDPALAGVERDGLPPYRTTDIFFQQIDLQRVAVPHADVQMRLFSRMVVDLLADVLPLPRLWYFPGNARTMLIVTGDSHVNSVESYTSLIGAVEAAGARMTIYLARFLNLLSSPAATWEAAGHELSVHPVFAEDGVSSNFTQGYDTVFEWFPLNVPAPVTPGPTVRHHTLEWTNWVGPVPIMNSRGIRMDLSYSAFGPTMHNPTQSVQAHGFLNGSGLPMRFVTEAGQVLPVYQQVTSIADEQLVAGLHSEGLSVADALAVSRSLIDDSQAGGYSALATQFHVDYYPLDHVKPWVDGTLAYAASQQIPMWNAERWLNFVEARASTQISNVAWNGGTGQLTLSIAVPANAPAQPVMVPPNYAGRVLTRVTVDGQTTAASALSVNGQATLVVAVAPAGGGAARTLVFYYDVPSALPAVSIGDAAVTEGNAGSSVAGLTVSLSAPTANDVAVSFTTTNGTATAGSDYQAVPTGSVIIPAGALSRPAQVTVFGDSNFEDDETVTVTLTNALGATIADGSAVLTIVNDEPLVAFPDAVSTAYVTPVTVPAPGVLSNDNAHGASGLRAVLISPAANGTVSLNANGGFSYTPNRWFAGVDTFTYRADTNTGTGNTVAVSIDVAHPTVVEAPRELRVSSMSGNLVTFRWRPPGVGPTPAGYLLEGGVAPGQPLVALGTSSAPIFTVAAPAGSFYVRFRTLGVGGPSPVSNEILIHVGVPVPPSPPANLQATSVGNGVHLAWTPTFAGGAASGYVLDVNGSLAASLPLPNVERLSFAGAPSGTYTLSLRAVNGGGSSAPSAPVPLTVPGACSGVPGAPTNLLAYTAGGTTFVVWDPPASGSAATSYVVSVPGIGALPVAQRSVSGPLPPGAYAISVLAVGPCGVSAPATQALTVP
jgi:hypothetical protein